MKAFFLSLAILLIVGMDAQAFHPGFGRANVQINVGRSARSGFNYGNFGSRFGFHAFGYGFGGVYPATYPVSGFGYASPGYAAPAYGLAGGCGADPLPPLAPQRTRVTIIESVP